MIEFNGVISKEIVKEYSKKENKINGLLFMPIIIICLVSAIIACIMHHNSFIHFCILTIVALLIDIALFFVPPRSIVFKLPKKILIQEKMIIESLEIDGDIIYKHSYDIKYVKKIIDYGQWFEIKWKKFFTKRIICQKDLLVNSSIEDFETKFKNIIIKR